MCIKTKYQNKKNNANKRGVKFLLTLEEFESLITKADVCDYTGVVFSDNPKSEHYKSVERIDKTKPYERSNCCMVTIKANGIKDRLEEQAGNISVQDMEVYMQIRRTLDTKTAEQLTSKYFETIKSKKENTMVTQNDDLTIAEEYIQFAKRQEEFELSFNKYKKLFARKTCQITGKHFESGKFNRRLIRRDQEEGWTDSNTITVCRIVGEVYASGLTTKEINKIGEMLC